MTRTYRRGPRKTGGRHLTGEQELFLLSGHDYFNLGPDNLFATQEEMRRAWRDHGTRLLAKWSFTHPGRSSYYALDRFGPPETA